MAADFWSSSHYKRWLVDRATLLQARADDLQYATAEDISLLNIFFGELISKLAKRLNLRQRVVATAIIFFRRFYLKNSYCETDPFIVAAACCYVAAKAEESHTHVKNVVSEARSLFAQDIYGVRNFTGVNPDNSKVTEMEFYLIDDLECDLVIFHPYRALLALCRKEGDLFSDLEAEAGELQAGLDSSDGPRYWGTGQGQLVLPGGVLQSSWFIINDIYHSDIPLIHPPHIIAVAAIYLALTLDSPTRTSLLSTQNSHEDPSRSLPQSSLLPQGSKQDVIGFLAGLNVSLPLIATVVQEIIAMYALWSRYTETSSASFVVLDRVHADKITPAALSALLTRMRESRFAELMLSGTGRPIAVNRMLERTQAAG